MTIHDLIHPGYIQLDLVAQTKMDVIDQMIDILHQHQAIDDIKGFKDDVLDRESISSTGIGFGIGIPHAKSTHVKIPSLIFAKSKEGVPFDSFDGKDAHLFFLIAMPEDGTNAHLKVLAMLSRKLMYEDYRQALFEAKTIEETLDLIYTMNY
ncbi:MAG: PTS fructose transporter subunit IIA [Acholeplasma sp.]|jgi:PTS system nitrogen regulatory IIA component|nr:MAG: PTS fructose transporter subunit IIA [Acholeplasma sp.]